MKIIEFCCTPSVDNYVNNSSNLFINSSNLLTIVWITPLLCGYIFNQPPKVYNSHLNFS